MSLKKLFGKKIKEIREAKGFTQQEFAELLNLQPNSIAQIECGYKGVSFNLLEKISEKLDVSYYELFDFSEKTTHSGLISALINEVSNLNDKTLKYIIDFVKKLKKFIK